MIDFPKSIKSILVTGGSGFIGGTLIRRLLTKTKFKIFNLDKLSYSSSFNHFQKKYLESNRYELLKVDLYNLEETKEAIKLSNPDLVFHLAAESHVDRSINDPKVFLESNIIGTFNLLEALIIHWENLSEIRKDSFRLLHVSTDEVFGMTEGDKCFSEKSPYNPRSPYSASKAGSDHLVRAWNKTYGLPTLITNSSNNFGPMQFPEKLIPVIITNGFQNKCIPIYGDGQNVRDWIYVEDHIDALIKVMLCGSIGDSYCIGAGEEKTNNEIVEIVCKFLDIYNSKNSPHIRLKKFVEDRKGHDQRYCIDSNKIMNDLKWRPKYEFNQALSMTVKWYIDNIDWFNLKSR